MLPVFSQFRGGRRPVAAGGGFVPTDISGLLVWLSADVGAYHDAGTTLATNGQTVLQWNDQSGNGNHVSSTGHPPSFQTGIVNSLPAILFDGATTVLKKAAATFGPTFTLFAVVETTGTGSGENMAISLDFPETPRVAQLRSAGTAVTAIGFASSTPFFATATGPGDNAWNLMSFVRSASSMQVWANQSSSGGPVSTTGSANSGSRPLYVGAYVGSPSSYFLGYIAEVLIYNSALSGTDRGTVETYLKAKYGI